MRALRQEDVREREQHGVRVYEFIFPELGGERRYAYRHEIDERLITAASEYELLRAAEKAGLDHARRETGAEWGTTRDLALLHSESRMTGNGVWREHLHFYEQAKMRKVRPYSLHTIGGVWPPDRPPC